MIIDYLYIAAGGALGAVTRHLVATVLVHSPDSIPWATLVVNIFGSFLLGYFSRANMLGHRQMLFVAVGFLGSLTTFSTHAIEIIERAGNGWPALAIGYTLATLTLGMIAAWSGAEIAIRRQPTTPERRP